MRRPNRVLVALALVVGALSPLTASAHVEPDPEIVGGHRADPAEYPFMVGLLLEDEPDTFLAQFCGGSLISPDTVLTAAHCLQGQRASDIDVLVGTNSLARNGGGTRVHARSLRIHPGFDARTFANDVGIVQLRLELPDDLVRTIQPGPDDASLWTPGTTATVIGWGDRAPGTGISFPTDLQEVDVPVRPDAYCGGRTHYGSAFLASKMFCAGDNDGGQDSCQGDSGGPILIRDDVTPVQIGIVSWGNGCAQAGFPGVYTELAEYSGFVNPYLDPDTAPGRVRQVRAERRPNGKVNVSWQPPVFDGGRQITRYRVTVRDTGQSWRVLARVSEYGIRNLPVGRHTIDVQAMNSRGTSLRRTVAFNG